MLNNAVVVKIINHHSAEILVVRETSCGKSCVSCGGCGVNKPTISVTALNTCGAKVGDRVIVESDTSGILNLAAIVYLMPVLLFFTGYFVAYSFIEIEWLRIIIGVAGFLLGLGVSKTINKRLRERGGIEHRIISIE